nr:MAG TPA: hypothetical protein [Caudoviricetes sp.]
MSFAFRLSGFSISHYVLHCANFAHNCHLVLPYSIVLQYVYSATIYIYNFKMLITTLIFK